MSQPLPQSSSAPMMPSPRDPDVMNSPAYPPPRRPVSLPTLGRSGPSSRVPSNDTDSFLSSSRPPFQPPWTPAPSIRHSTPSNSSLNLPSSAGLSRPVSRQSWSKDNPSEQVDSASYRTPSRRIVNEYNRDSSDSTPRSTNWASVRDIEVPITPTRSRLLRGPHAVLRESSLRLVSRPSDEDLQPPKSPPNTLAHSHSDSRSTAGRSRPHTHPSSRADARSRPFQLNLEDLGALRAGHPEGEMPWSMPTSRPSTPGSMAKPKPSFSRLSSLDNFMQYREEKEEWKRMSRSSSLVQNRQSEQLVESRAQERAKTFAILDDSAVSSLRDEPMMQTTQNDFEVERDENLDERRTVRANSKFRYSAAETGFCITIAMTQFLAEYLISGFAIELPRLLQSDVKVGTGSTGIFWPASLLSLILSATLLFFARLSDMCSGYCIFMFGVGWLGIWTLIPGFFHNIVLLNVARAMQGLAIAAFTPSTFAMVGSIYSEGRRKNVVMGMYAGCAPLGFFSGFAVAGALPVDKPGWYFFIASAVAFATLLMAYLTVPADRTDRRRLGLKMDWIGSFLIVVGLILVSYALAVEPYANQLDTAMTGWSFPIVYAPFASGIVCLAVAFWYEGWCATCPLLPFDFFKPKSVKPFSLACLCFYASFGVWLYNSAQYFESPTGTTNSGSDGISGRDLALWYLPTAIGGLILCFAGGSLMHRIPIMSLLLTSAMAWIAAPLLLALAPLPLDYWSFVLPSMLCATIGIDLTFTISIVYFSSVQPLKYQGLSGAMASSLVNLAMSFALSISEIVMKKASSTKTLPDEAVNWGYKATFLYAAGSAGIGLVICALAVRISRSVVQEQSSEDREEQPTPTYPEATLVDEMSEREERHRNEDAERTGTN